MTKWGLYTPEDTSTVEKKIRPIPTPKPRPLVIPDNIKRTIEWMCDRMAAMYGDKSKPAGGNIGDVRKWLEGK